MENYTILKRIGSGAYGEVSLAKENKTNKLYAVQVLNYTGDQVIIDSFIKEIKIMLKLKHPAIIKFIGYSLKNKAGVIKPTIVMEYAPNESIETFLNLERSGHASDKWDNTTKAISMYGIASAMKHVHSRGVLHRNLKPSCVLLDAHLFPKVGDFAIAVDLSDSAEDAGMAGTPLFMPPEVIDGGQWTKAGDVYSFAVLLYMLLTTEVPFRGKNQFQIFNAVTRGERPVIGDYVPKFLRDLVAACWSQEPERRPTFSQIVDMLREGEGWLDEFGVDEEEYENYCNKLDPVVMIGMESEPSSSYSEDEDVFKNFRKVDLSFDEEEEMKELAVNCAPIDLSRFERKEEVGRGGFGSVSRVVEKGSGKVFAAKVNFNDLFHCSDIEVTNLSREVNILSMLSSPVVLKFVGYSPNDFDNEHRPTIVTEYIATGSLGDVIKAERNGLSSREWNDTKRLINIYGVASGMKYLHSKNVLHRDLKPDNIFVDEFLFPRIGDFGLAKVIQDDGRKGGPVQTSGNLGTPCYMSPEIINGVYIKPGDVYAFAILVYEMVTLEEPFKRMPAVQLAKDVCSGSRPEIPADTPDCYRALITQCWSQEPEKRPTFSKIVDMLKSDPGFTSGNVDKDEFIEYIESIGDSYDFESAKKKKKGKKRQPLRKVSFDLKKVEERDRVKEILDSDQKLKESFLDLSKFELKSLVSKGATFNIYEVRDRATKDVYSAKVSAVKMSMLTREELISLSREVNTISKLKHPSFLRFVGYSPTDFRQQSMPVVVSEIASNRSLAQLVDRERRGVSIPSWDSTAKLIVIYGTAAGMAYLHAHKIIHRNLALNSIFLDGHLFPKIGNFGLSVRKHTLASATLQSTAGIKGNPAFSSPEVLSEGDFSEASDVYAFAFIVFQLLTLQVPFSGVRSLNDLYSEVVDRQARPSIPKEVPESYRKLIELCWSQNPSARPSFEDIASILVSDGGFITAGVSRQKFREYVDAVENAEVDFYPDRKVANLDDLIREKGRIDEEARQAVREDGCPSEEVLRKVEEIRREGKLAMVGADLVGGLLAGAAPVPVTPVRVGAGDSDSDFVSVLLLGEPGGKEAAHVYECLAGIRNAGVSRPVALFSGGGGQRPAVVLERFVPNLKKSVKSLESVFLVSLVYEVAHAMQKAHEAGVAHLNLSHESVFVDCRKHAKVAGFDAVFRADPVAPVFAPAELLLGKPHSEKADVFSFGMLMYFILTRGRGPFFTRESIEAGRPLPIKRTINRVAFSIITQCLAHSPGARPTFKAITKSIVRYGFALVDGIESELQRLHEQLKSIVEMKKVKEKKQSK